MTSPSHGGIEIVRLGQAGFEISTATTRIAIDPFSSDYPGRLLPAVIDAEELASMDAVLVSHEHADHLDLPLLAAMPESHTRVVVPAPLAERVRHSLPDREIVEARDGDVVTIGDVSITPVAALHGVHMHDAYSFGVDSRGDHSYLGYIIEIGGRVLFHAGDAIDYPELARRLASANVDTVLLPINGRDAVREALDIVGNMTASEAADLAARSGASIVIPMHYDMFAGNPGPVGHFVDVVRYTSPALHVLVPGLAVPIHLPPVRSTRSQS